MTSLNHDLQQRFQTWCWPVDSAQYDATPALSLAEKNELDTIVQVFKHGNHHWPAQSKTILQRLLRPIQDVMNVIGASTSVAKGAAKFFVREMHLQGTPFWAWSTVTWTKVLGADSQEFARGHTRSKGESRQAVLAVGYLLCHFTDLPALGMKLNYPMLANKIFGCDRVKHASVCIHDALLPWGYSERRIAEDISRSLCFLLLLNQSPHLEDLTKAFLETIRQQVSLPSIKDDVVAISCGLTSLGILHQPLNHYLANQQQKIRQEHPPGASEEWAHWCQRWRDTSTLAPGSRQRSYYALIEAGRWLAMFHPEITTPDGWTRELATEFVAAVDRKTVGAWTGTASIRNLPSQKMGKPIMARTKVHHLVVMRQFFRDLQEWEWIPRRFDPGRSFATPRAVSAQVGPDPRTIEDDIWAKLLWAGLNLASEDLVGFSLLSRTELQQEPSYYPVEMVRAMSIVWLFAGLRSQEFRRLRVGCVRWQQADVVISGTQEVLPKDAICWLDIPVHKSGTAMTKAVDRVVGEAISVWERVRPVQVRGIDAKTGEIVDFLFAYRGRQVGKRYLNEHLIPLLCRKGGVPEHDARGDITSHRARSTIASQLFNAKEPMTLFELQEWLGHRSIFTTQHYAKRSPTQVAKSYEKAEYFRRNLRTIAVLIDQEAVKSGMAAQGIPWKYFDLGHAYCTYDFFEQCPHRMACARCSFYIPKGSTQAQLLEAKANLQWMLQEIPLTEDERAAVEDGINAMEKLCQQLADVPTPAGPTPNQMALEERKNVPLIPIEAIQRKRRSK